MPLTGYYGLEQCSRYVRKYMAAARPRQRVYGLLPATSALGPRHAPIISVPLTQTPHSHPSPRPAPPAPRPLSQSQHRSAQASFRAKRVVGLSTSVPRWRPARGRSARTTRRRSSWSVPFPQRRAPHHELLCRAMPCVAGALALPRACRCEPAHRRLEGSLSAALGVGAAAVHVPCAAEEGVPEGVLRLRCRGAVRARLYAQVCTHKHQARRQALKTDQKQIS